MIRILVSRTSERIRSPWLRHSIEQVTCMQSVTKIDVRTVGTKIKACDESVTEPVEWQHPDLVTFCAQPWASTNITWLPPALPCPLNLAEMVQSVRSPAKRPHENRMTEISSSPPCGGAGFSLWRWEHCPFVSTLQSKVMHK